MLNNQEKSINYYLFSISNFMAALGGGMILGKGMNAINIPQLQGGSLLAFFVGTIWGLGLLQLLPKKLSNIFAPWFSMCGGLVSLILFSCFMLYSVNQKVSSDIGIIFFLLLSIRFGFWFYSRVLRASSAAGQKQRIAWVEFGYYSGIILGLVLWIFLGIKLGLAAALILDSFLQIAAGVIDLYVHRRQSSNNNKNNPIEKNTLAEISRNILRDKKIWGWRLASAVMLLTVAIQVIIFNLAHQVSDIFSPYILAIFYFGAAVSTIFYKRLNMELEWIVKAAKNRGYAVIAFGRKNNKKSVSFLLGSLLAGLGVITVIIGVLHWNWGNQNSSFGFNEYCLLIFVFISTFFYGILELAILDRIGLEEHNSPHKGMILRTYGLMSIAAAISLWILQITQSSLWGLNLTFSICFLLTILSVRIRTIQKA